MDEGKDTADSLAEDSNLLDGTYPIQLSPETQLLLECEAGGDLHELDPMKTVPIHSIRADLQAQGTKSDFHALAEELQKCILEHVLLIFDPTHIHGTEFLICLNVDSKFGYLNAQEELETGLIDKKTPFVYKSAQPRPWSCLGSGTEVETAWERNSRTKIRLKIKCEVPRPSSDLIFTNRDVQHAKDGYVACDAYEESKYRFHHVHLMDRAVQAVPVTMEGCSQTDLKHPKNISIQYQARAFEPAEVAEIWKSVEMKSFLSKAERIMEEVQRSPDIMGDLRSEVESFYRRDEVIVIEETKFVYRTFFSELVFSHEKRVTQVKWHPHLSYIMAMAVIENVPHEDYLEHLSTRLVMPNVVMIWNMNYNYYPQILLRVVDDVTQLKWHPFEPEVLVGGCSNGQLMIWDLDEYYGRLKDDQCTWDCKTFVASPNHQLYAQDGYIPLLHWSAESSKEHSHLCGVEDLKWLPKTVWFSYDSAFPKQNQMDDEVQLISCDGDSSVLIWALRKPPADDGVDSSDMEDNFGPKRKSTSSGWEKLKLQSALPASISMGKKYSPAVGRYEPLNRIWRPVHRICFIDPRVKFEDTLLTTVITSVDVIDRPDLIIFNRKDSSLPSQPDSPRGSSANTERPPARKPSETPSIYSRSSSRSHSPASKSPKRLKKTSGGGGKSKSNRIEAPKHYDSSDDPDESGEEKSQETDPAQMALPTFLMAGTMFGSIFRVDLTKVKVDVESNNLICKIEWESGVHDGPVRLMKRCPHYEKLLLTVGGYSWAIWSETNPLPIPVVLHYVDDFLFTDVAWSLTQPHRVFFSDEKGEVQVWDLRSRKSEPFQTQVISGRTINVISPLVGWNADGEETNYLSVGDETGTVHVLEIPRHLCESNAEELDDLKDLVANEVQRIKERDRLQIEKKAAGTPTEKVSKLTDDFDEERRIAWEEKEYLKVYFQRERFVLEESYGEDWKKYLKFPELPRKKYFVEQKRRGSSEERRRQKELALKAKKKKGGSIFRK